MPRSLRLLVAGALAVAPALAQEPDDCALCHDEVVTAVARTIHGAAPHAAAASCASCHGPGDAHMEAGGDPELIVRPRTLAPRAASDICTTCHRREEEHFRGSVAIHRLADVGCLDCHVVHSTAEALVERADRELCGACHAGPAAELELPRAHPVVSRTRACTTCHDPHAARTPRAVRQASACGQCHFEKTGPFVYEHDTTFVDGCAACHEVHGSTNRHLLRHEMQINLCYECHSAAHTPGFHAASEYASQKCTSCHAAIHGSNTNQLFLEN
jgi:DmsE family decaheme c-type cytochrome